MERMIEIIKHGNKTKRTCKKCGCIFTYESEDVQIEKRIEKRLNPIGIYIKYIDCPQCNDRIFLAMSK